MDNQNTAEVKANFEPRYDVLILVLMDNQNTGRYIGTDIFTFSS